MKRLRRFNESVDTLDKEYIKDCFVEFLDDIRNKIYDENSDYADGYKRELYGDSFIEVYIALPKLNEMSFDEIVDMNNKLNEIYTELQTCIDKVKIKYNYKYDIEFEYSEFENRMKYNHPTHISINIYKE
jgi:hypothetical protein